MKKVFIDSHNLITSLGSTSEANFTALKNNRSGVLLHDRPDIDTSPFWASIVQEEQFKSIADDIKNPAQYTRFEKLLIASIADAVKNSNVDPSNSKTIFIFSTTKGNIAELENMSDSTSKLNLAYSGKHVTAYFKNSNQPVIISNACISGIVALLYAQRLLQSGEYENAVVTGADTMSRFVFSGFKSFQALSPTQCKPFSLNRDGINLGEAAATIVLTNVPEKLTQSEKIQVNGGAICNDSNHISGPSRTGEELSHSINSALQESGISSKEIDFVSAHGTATIFNDEMEAKAFNLSHLQNVPVNSLKGYFGHTLGAAGLVESIVSILSMQEGVLIPTMGFTELGVSPSINICNKKTEKEINYCLKTASGFGGCNAAIVFSKS